MGKLAVLLKYEIKAHSTFNAIKYNKGKGRGGKIGALIGKTILYLMLIAFVFFTSMGMTFIDKDGVTIPILTTVVISAVSLIFTLLKTSGYMFAYKEYDMLMSLPFSVKTIASAKFLYMYIFNVGVTLCVMIPAIVACLIFSNMSVLGAIIWFVLSFFVPMIPMIIATALGSLITGAGGKFKYKRVVQIALTMVFIFACFFARFFFEWLFKSVGALNVVSNISSFMAETENYYLPAYWLQQATEGKFLYALLFLAVSLGLFELYFIIISKFYRQINSRLKVKAFHKEFKMSKQKIRSVKRTLVNKEFLRFKGSNNYLINTAIGLVLIFVLSIVAIFFDMDSVLHMLAPGVPEDRSIKGVFLLAVPFFVYFFVGMSPTTTVSYSLEGNNFWIVKSLPITGFDLVNAKMIFNFILYVPFQIFATIILGIKFGASFLDIMLFVLVGIVLCGFSTVYGMLLGISFPKLDWENEIDVIKRSTPPAIYIFSNMLIAMAGVGLGIVLELNDFSPTLFSIATIVVFGIISLLLLLRVKKKSERLL
jgi:ABC-2 type transport system permease protein